MTKENLPSGHMGYEEANIRNSFVSGFGYGKSVTVDDVYNKLMKDQHWADNVLFDTSMFSVNDDPINDYDRLPRGYDRMDDLLNAAEALDTIAEDYVYGVPFCKEHPDETRRFAEELHAFATRKFVSDEQFPNEVVLQEIINEFVNALDCAIGRGRERPQKSEEYMRSVYNMARDRITQLLHNNPQFAKEFDAHDYDTHVVRVDICNDCREKELMNPDED